MLWRTATASQRPPLVPLAGAGALAGPLVSAPPPVPWRIACRIASAAETYDIYIAPHSAIGPIALAACLQLDFAMPNALIQEQGIGYTETGLDNEGSDILDYLVDTSVFEIAQGHIKRPRGPGLGIEIDEQAVVRAAAIGHSWKFMPWYHSDGSYAER